jgi:hypothetical protein
MRRICSFLLALLWATAITAAENPNGVLVRYSFDDGLTDTGPDTFAVFQNAKGHVRLSSQFRFSGYRSIELRDVANDQDFPELQGYFPLRKSGELYFHFTMLVANPEQALNVALAGPSHFSVTEDGIAFWLKTREGMLYHVSDSIPKKLFRLEPFVWYSVDVRLDIPHGTYDLTIRKEGSPAPLVALTAQPNSANAPGSSVHMFSFVGSVYEDDSDVTYYVDDVVLGTDEQVTLAPFVAPGRRKLFIDRWRETRALMLKNPGCAPVLSFEDFGLTEPAETGDALMLAYHRTCDVMKKNPAAAAKQFRNLAAQHPNAPIFSIGELAALVQAEDEEAARRRWEELEPLLHNDVRYGMLAAMMGLESDRQDDETRYFVLIWKGEFSRAALLAEKNGWPERAGDALFLAGSPTAARPLYERALRENPQDAYWPTVKLSDIAHLLGDAQNEKVYREKMYGALRE